MSSQIFGKTPASRRASLNLLLSPEMFPRHQMVYSLTSMCVGESIMEIRIGMAWFSINLSTKWLSLDAILVRHQIASNWSLGDSTHWPSWKRRGIRLRSTVFWMGGSVSKDRSFLRPVTARIWTTWMSELRRLTIYSKSDCYENNFAVLDSFDLVVKVYLLANKNTSATYLTCHIVSLLNYLLKGHTLSLC